MVHRGPDEEGIYVDGAIGLGMRRLSIIDLEGGSQPISNEDGSICVVQNGEIYNFQELRQRLTSLGHRFTSRCDTEVIVHLYEQYGLSFVDHLNGMFAIAIWDSVRRRLVLVRDRLGVKPLYYSVLGEKLVFASEIKCLLQHDDVSTEPDRQAVYDYFCLGYIPQPRSIYASIRKLAPAGRLVAENGRISIDRYWTVPNEIDRSLTRDQAKTRLRELLTDAVGIRMISDVPLGAFLSGGLDSSIVVALMAQQSTSPVKTFFIDFDEPKYSERDYANAVAARYGTDHYELLIRPSALDVLDRIVEHFDEPFGDASAIPTFYVSQLTRQHVTVALAGDGGDESFGGYKRYRRILSRHSVPIARRVIRPFANTVASAMPRGTRGRLFLQSLGLSNSELYGGRMLEYEAQRLLTHEFLTAVRQDLTSEVGVLEEPANGADRLAPYSRWDVQWYLPDDILTKVDRMSMAHSLEVRGPFLDYRVIELAARMPVEWKINSGNTKAILKEAFGEQLPQKVVSPRKRGFSMPLAEWFRGELRPALFDVLENRELAQSGIFRMNEIRGLVEEHLGAARDRASQLWRILFFVRWWDAHRNKSARPVNFDKHVVQV